MPDQNNPKKNRYPGIRSFETSEQHLFFGRTRETEDLYHLVTVESLSVLFAKSGMGKTSLINAGLVPLLKKDNYYPIYIRFQDTSLSPLTHIKIVLDKYININKLTQFGQQKNPLWEWIKACEFDNNAIPVLIFDQFEEFFSHPKTDRQAFTKQLADLINYYIPNEQETAFRKIPRKARTPEQLAWYQQPDLRILVSIRSDRLSHLDEMTVYIPPILHNRFHLKPLDSTQAKTAIIKPALLTGGNYAALPFTYASATVQHIQNQLSDEKQGHIESFQLQLLCSTIEEKVSKQQQKGLEKVIVTPDYLKEKSTDSIKAGIQNILNNYYESKLAELSAADSGKVRKFIEEGLIEANPHDPTHGKRVNVAEARVQNKYDITEKLLQQLLYTRLIRAENTHLGRVYEVSHDTLVTPILQSLAIRKTQETQARLRNRIRLGFMIGIPVLGVLVGAVFLFASLASTYKEANKKAEIAKKVAEQNLNKFKVAEIEKFIRDIEIFNEAQESTLIQKKLIDIDILLNEMPKKQIDSFQTILKKYR